MKVLHINTSQVGGAALCAERINNSLVQEGIDSRMLFAEGTNMPDGIKGAIATRDNAFLNRDWVLRKVRNLLARFPWYMDVEKAQKLLNTANKDHLYVHHPYSEYKNITCHPLVKWADVVHLHWVAGFVDYPTFFKELEKPIVWTLHDKYPAVGVQHFCSEFFPIPESLKLIDEKCKQIKRRGIIKAKNLQLVAISKHILDVCEGSDVLKGIPVSLINNGVDTNVFTMYDKYNVRRSLGLVEDAKVFLFSAHCINDENKGLFRLMSALENVDISNKLLVCIGQSLGSLPNCSFPVILTGSLNDQDKIAKYYSAADFFLQCSYEESFGQTVIEAMSCGTPVISTPCGISLDIISAANGVLCDGFDSNALVLGINEAVRREFDPIAIRKCIVDSFQNNTIARRYIELYHSVLDKERQR